MSFGAVIAIDNSPVRLALARHNAIIYGVQDRIEFILADFPSFVRSYLAIPSDSSAGEPSSPTRREPRTIDVVFLSPPWGGPSYISQGADTSMISEPATAAKHPEFTMDMIAPLPGDELFDLARSITPNVAYYLPRNTNLEQLSALVPSPDPPVDGSVTPEEPLERIEVEEEWTGPKLKALTCYFGGLVKGQEHMWTS